MEKTDIQKLVEVVAMLTPEMLNGLYHGISFFSEEQQAKIEEANEIAKKYIV